MSSLTRAHVQKNWIPSIGDGDGEHFREPPPGRRHAVCKHRSKYCRVHEDEYNPHAGPIDTIAHVLFEWKLAPLAVAGIVVGALLFGAATKNNQVQYLCPSCGVAIFSPIRGLSYQCQSCKNWFYVA